MGQDLDSKIPFPRWLCISEKELSYGAGPLWSPAGLVTAVVMGSGGERCSFTGIGIDIYLDPVHWSWARNILGHPKSHAWLF